MSSPLHADSVTETLMLVNLIRPRDIARALGAKKQSVAAMSGSHGNK